MLSYTNYSLPLLSDSFLTLCCYSRAASCCMVARILLVLVMESQGVEVTEIQQCSPCEINIY